MRSINDNLTGEHRSLCKVVVHDIQKRSEVVLGGVVAVHTVVDSDEPNAFLRKKHLRIEPNLQIISSKS